MKWLKDIIISSLNSWHTEVHSNYDLMKVVEANKRIGELEKKNQELDRLNKSLKLQLEIKQMNDFLQTGRL